MEAKQDENASKVSDLDEIVTFAPRDEDDSLSTEYVIQLKAELEQGDTNSIIAKVSGLHEADLADLLEALDREERTVLVRSLGSEFDFTALTELEESDRIAILDDMTATEVAEGVRDLDSDDAVFILEDLDEPEQKEILNKLPMGDQLALKKSLDYPEETAGRRMQTDFIAIPPFWTVGQTIDYIRSAEELPDEFYGLYVIDPAFRLMGSIKLDRFLRAQRDENISDIMKTVRFTLEATADQEEAALLFERYDLVSAAVVDEAKRLVGILTIDDIVDVINQEAEEDIKRLAGVGEEDLSANVAGAIKSRFTWLGVNLVTSIIASLVISMFDATIEQMVALAVLMPIVASMGGNAGTQTMTIAVRALATNDIDNFNAGRIIKREGLVGLANGIIFAVIIGAVAAVWFSSGQLGIVIGIAMVANMICAGLAGILIPISLSKINIDPAIASTAFVTTVTDIVGFFAFLGLAAWWFNLM